MVKIPVAVHLVTESSDHYTHLIHAVDAEHFIKELDLCAGDELKYVSDHFVESNDVEFNKELSNAIQTEIDSRRDS